MPVVPDDPNMAQAWISGTPPDQTIDFYIPRGNQGLEGPRGPIGPSMYVGSIETNMGPAAPGTVGAQGVPGAKGDPGGWVASIDVGANNLNSYITPGLYKNWTNTNATLARNYPAAAVNYTNTIEVIVAADSSDVIQRLTVLGTSTFIGKTVHIRRYYLGTWTSWVTYSSSRVDQTAGRVIYQWDDLNQREQLIYGDTGWRDITTSIIAPFTVNSMRIRRIASRVTLKWDSLTSGPAGAPSGTAYSAPAGFQVSTSEPLYYGRAHIEQAANSIGNLWSYGWNGASLAPGQCVGTWFNGVYFNGGITYLTDDPWPTTLPGTAIGTIPNI